MTIGTTHDATLSRVRVAVSAAPANADYATIERSTDGITWTVVRGGEAAALVAGACQVDDYEFAPNVLNTYRATYVDTATPSIPGLGVTASAVNASVSPGLPGGMVDGDLMVLKAAIRNTAGAVSTPTGWTPFVNMGNFCLFTRTYVAGTPTPTVNFTGGVAGADTVARIIAVRNTDTPVATTLTNASAQNIDFPAISAAGLLPNRFIRAGWKQATSTSSDLPGWTAISRDAVTAGDDETVVWWQKTGSANEAAAPMTIVGGAAAVSKAVSIRFPRKAFHSQESTTITPPLTQVWLKNVQRPFLNTPIKVVGFSNIVRPSRSGVHEIVGRSDAIAVTERRGGKRFSLRVEASSIAEAEEMDTRLSDGAVIFLHTPADCPFPGGYYLIDETSTGRPPTASFSVRRYIELPLIQVAAPSAAVVGSTYTWQGVVNDYATWSALLAANATWGALLENIGDPTDVVVP